MFRRKRPRVDALHAGAAMAEGWNGLLWGASLTTFRATFPRAHPTESGWWQTGQGPEPFCDVPMAITQYAFNKRGELCMVSFIPAPDSRARLSVAAMNGFGPPVGMDLVWTFGDVVAEVKLGGVVATLTHPTYSDR